MIAEVEHYRTHHWMCNKCGNMVKRSMNRAPQEADCWRRAGSSCRDPRCSWHMHLRHCGGEFVKVKEPEGFQQRRGRSRGRQKSGTHPTLASDLFCVHAQPMESPTHFGNLLLFQRMLVIQVLRQDVHSHGASHWRHIFRNRKALRVLKFRTQARKRSRRRMRKIWPADERNWLQRRCAEWACLRG